MQVFPQSCEPHRFTTLMAFCSICEVTLQDAHVFLIPKAELAALCLLCLAAVQAALLVCICATCVLTGTTILQQPPPANRCMTRLCFGTQVLQPSVRGEYRQRREQHTGGRNTSSRKLSACRSSLTTHVVSAARCHCMQENRQPTCRKP